MSEASKASTGSIESTNWSDLRTKGFVHIRGFLGASETEALYRDYCLPTPGVPLNQNYDVVPVSGEAISRLDPRLTIISNLVRDKADIDTDMTSGALYFATKRGIAFPWHQDHETYFFYQDHKHHLNFYIPILKPSATQSNLCIVPFDELLRKCPEANCLVGGGAKIFASTGRATVVFDDETDRQSMLPVDFESIAVTPTLHAGDLLLLRGDMIHRTQDTETERVSISIRRLRSSHQVRKDRLLSGGVTKREMLRNNPFEYETILECFSDFGSDSVCVRDILTRLHAKASGDDAESSAAK